MAMRNAKLGLPMDEGKNLKVTLEDLERMKFEDIWENKPDDFKPQDILEDVPMYNQH